MKITAALLTDEHPHFQRWELDLGEPGPDEVLVKMSVTGICHLDQVFHSITRPTLPAVLGHEGEGVVEQVGPGVTTFRPGDNVVLSPSSCGRCVSCRSGAAGYCDDFAAHNLYGTRLDGSTSLSDGTDAVSSHFYGQSSFATHAVVPTRSLVAVEDEYAPLGLLGPLGCGFGTGMGAVLDRLAPDAGSSIAIFGGGAVGVAAVLAARVAACTTIVAVAKGAGFGDTDLGYTRFIDATNEKNPAEKIKESTGGRGVDYAVETTGDPAMLSEALDCLAFRGTACLVSRHPTSYMAPLTAELSLRRGCTLTTSIGGEIAPQRFIPLVTKLYGAGRFPLHDLVTHYDFVDINQAFEDLDAGRVIKPVLSFERESEYGSDRDYGVWSTGSD